MLFHCEFQLISVQLQLGSFDKIKNNFKNSY